MMAHRMLLRRTLLNDVYCGVRQVSSVGFIGLGNMGSGMAANLLRKGKQVVAYDVASAALTALENQGARAAASPREVAQQCGKIVTMLPTNAHVEEVLTGPQGLIASAKKGTLLIDCSTVGPDLSVRMSKEAENNQLKFVDAPVSGGVNAAKAGTLTFMVGGSEADVTSAEEVLLDMGKAAIRCGPVGCGGAAKICNNMMLAISMVGHSETMNLGIQLGLDPQVLNQILNMSSGKSWVSDVYSPVPGVMPNVPSSNNYQGGFGSALMLKDLSLAQDAATQTQAPTPLGGLALQLYRIICAQGHGRKDFGYVFKFLSKTGDVQMSR
ncbi:3-hydroxyisobutyrate dehydrogenase [Tropilaelaps mercedesae]|uniref:3-hydroxyisobutyrate dehydrogenase n=1 Tax=Tropilaelaps mercedesae TaxID=418985 RepID=A0A1V9XWV5_9ACAR|nr:3-hydroxyisobutyrate dehydrogenase [Tropilaelaps mercedesae]